MGKRIKTVIASVLKPVDDVRMYKKIGLSLQQTNRYAVNIIGFRSKKLPEDNKINFYPLYHFRAKSIQRIFSSIVFFKTLLRIQPRLLIVTTYELLPAACLYCWVDRKVKLVYDVRENYALNVLSNRKGSGSAKVLANLIRTIEIGAQYYIILNILAESNYTKELSFLVNTLVIRNKFVKPRVPLSQKKIELVQKKILYCGTISESYGIWQAVYLAKKLAEEDKNFSTKIIGHVTHEPLLDKLKLITHPALSFDISPRPIPHDYILEAMSQADYGMIAHQLTSSIKNCFPTRIYEFMHFNIPILLQSNPYWVDFCKTYHACIALDFNQFDASKIMEQMNNQQFYNTTKRPDIYWETEEEKLLKALDKLFNVIF